MKKKKNTISGKCYDVGFTINKLTLTKKQLKDILKYENRQLDKLELQKDKVTIYYKSEK